MTSSSFVQYLFYSNLPRSAFLQPASLGTSGGVDDSTVELHRNLCLELIQLLRENLQSYHTLCCCSKISNHSRARWRYFGFVHVSGSDYRAGIPLYSVIPLTHQTLAAFRVHHLYVAPWPFSACPLLAASLYYLFLHPKGCGETPHFSQLLFLGGGPRLAFSDHRSLSPGDPLVIISLSELKLLLVWAPCMAHPLFCPHCGFHLSITIRSPFVKPRHVSSLALSI